MQSHPRLGCPWCSGWVRSHNYGRPESTLTDKDTHRCMHRNTLALALLCIWVISVLYYVIIQLPEGDLVSAKIDGLMRSGLA